MTGGPITPAMLANRPKPAAPRPTSTDTLHAPTTSDPHKFGRIDADGTVWVRTDDGERSIGSWQAGDTEAGLAHFGRRYDDISTEVALLETRLTSGSGDARKTKKAAAAILESLPTAAVIGDLEALATRLNTVLAHSDDAIANAAQERSARQQEAVARKEALIAEAEGMSSDSTQWKAAGDRLKAILEEWKTIHGLDRKTDDVLWKRFSKAREAFNRRRGAHFAELDRERAHAKSTKEELCVRAEALSGSTDWAKTAAQYRELLAEWKAAGRAPRDADDTLWQRFKQAQDTFFAARNAVSAERDAEFSANAAAKQELLVLAEKINPAADLEAAKSALRDVQTKWEQIGKVPRELMSSLDGRLKAVERKVRDAVDSQWRRSDPEAVARAAQFRDRVRAYEEQAAKAEAQGKTKDAAKAREQARQWEEWAAAAQAAVDNL